MRFVICGLKYDTDNMEEVAKVKKWYPIDNAIIQAIYQRDVGRYYWCTLWKSKKGNYLLTHEIDYKKVGEAITEDEAKELLTKYAIDKYEELYGNLPEA